MKIEQCCFINELNNSSTKRQSKGFPDRFTYLVEGCLRVTPRERFFSRFYSVLSFRFHQYEYAVVWGGTLNSENEVAEFSERARHFCLIGVTLGNHISVTKQIKKCWWKYILRLERMNVALNDVCKIHKGRKSESEHTQKKMTATLKVIWCIGIPNKLGEIPLKTFCKRISNFVVSCDKRN